MPAPRSTSLRALRTVTRQHVPAPPSSMEMLAPFRRSLHITDAYSARPAAGADVLSIYRSRSLPDLKIECEKRNISTTGTKAELIDRLTNHDLLQSRAYSIAIKRIDGRPPGAQSPAERQPRRHINTSRAQKAPNDSSTVDFVYMPKNLDEDPSIMGSPRVPILPDAYTHYLYGPSTPSPMKPEIYTVSGMNSDVSGPSPLSEVVDNHAVDIDPFHLTETVTRARNRAAASAATGENNTVSGAVKELWNGFLDDLLGPKQPRGTARSN